MDGVYATLARGADLTGEIEVRRSRFRAVVRRVGDEAAARALVEEQRRAYRDARHHCSAFVLGPPPSTERSNDDGEPSGTAGAPMLEVLRGHGLSDVCAVVVRWFGGTLLGTGGLARAYAEAVETTLAHAPTVRRVRRELVTLTLPHADAGRVESELRARDVQVRDTTYGADGVRLLLAPADVAALTEQVAALTAGAVAPEPAGATWLDLPPGQGV